MKPSNESVALVELNEMDARGLIELSASVGWDYDEEEVATLLSSSYKIYGHKNVEGEVVSSGAIIHYHHTLASIGMVIVHDHYRGLGLGKEVMEKCIESGRDRSSC